MPAANVGCWSVQPRRDGVESIWYRDMEISVPCHSPHIIILRYLLQPWCSAWCSSICTLSAPCLHICLHIRLHIRLHICLPDCFPLPTLHYKADLYAARVRGKAVEVAGHACQLSHRYRSQRLVFFYPEESRCGPSSAINEQLIINVADMMADDGN